MTGASIEATLEGDITLTRWRRFGRYVGPMMLRPVSYERHRFPPEIIAHAVWLY